MLCVFIKNYHNSRNSANRPKLRVSTCTFLHILMWEMHLSTSHFSFFWESTLEIHSPSNSLAAYSFYKKNHILLKINHLLLNSTQKIFIKTLFCICLRSQFPPSCQCIPIKPSQQSRRPADSTVEQEAILLHVPPIGVRLSNT